MKSMYTTGAICTGGNHKVVKSENNVLNLEIRSPKALGGENNNYTNPEMLFSAGYAACLDSALSLVIMKNKIATGTTAVKATTRMFPHTNGGFIFSIEVWVNIPNVSVDVANELTEKAHKICPFANSTASIETVVLVTNQSEEDCEKAMNSQFTSYPIEEYDAKIVPNHILIDVRTEEEYAEMRLPNSMNIPWVAENFEKRISELDRNTPIYVHCKLGRRSMLASHKIKAMGFQEVVNLEGGIIRWINKGKEVLK